MWKKGINKCCHCKKSVTEVVKCRKCGNSFHSACLMQASRLRSAEYVHFAESKVRSGSVVDCVDTQELLQLRTLVKELQSKNQILEENNCLLREQVSNLEEKLKISKDTLEKHKRAPSSKNSVNKNMPRNVFRKRKLLEFKAKWKLSTDVLEYWT